MHGLVLNIACKLSSCYYFIISIFLQSLDFLKTDKAQALIEVNIAYAL